MSANILAIGPFSDDIADDLEYSAEQYAGTRLGVPVITELFTYMPGSTASRAFAEHLGITDPWDFNQHKIDATRVDVQALRQFLGTVHDPAEFLPDLERFQRLRDKGFTFYFQPNG